MPSVLTHLEPVMVCENIAETHIRNPKTSNINLHLKLYVINPYSLKNSITVLLLRVIFIHFDHIPIVISNYQNSSPGIVFIINNPVIFI